MENLKNLPPFYIGQRVVCVAPVLYTSSRNYLSKGKVYKITGIKKCGCGCGILVVSVGVKAHRNEYICGDSNRLFYEDVNEMFFKHYRFSPIQEQKFPLIKLTKVLEENKELVSAN